MLDGFRPGIAVATGIGLFGLLVSLTGLVSDRRARLAAIADITDGDGAQRHGEFAMTAQER